MNDAAIVGRVECLRDLPANRHRFGDADRAERDSFGECPALDEFKDEHLDARGVFFETVNLRNIRVIERGQRLRFTCEARKALNVARKCLG